jgi:simple sugar transport system ATP-binding protein
LDEIFALADRVLVMTSGRISGELPIEACTEAGVGCLMGDATPSGAAPVLAPATLP